MSNATNLAVATVTNAMTIAGLEMLNQPELNRYCTSRAARESQHNARIAYRTKAVKRVLQSELNKQSVRTGDPQYFIIVSRFRDLPDDTFIECLETIPFVGSRGDDSPIWDMPGMDKNKVKKAVV